MIPTNNDIPSGFFNITSYLSDVPLTLPEGGKKPGTCNGCRGLFLTNSTTKAVAVVRAGLAEAFFGNAVEIARTGLVWRSSRATQHGLEEAVMMSEDDEHPSWGAQCGRMRADNNVMRHLN